MTRKLPMDDAGRVDIKSLSLVELQDRMSDLGKASYRALQVYKWIWQRGARSFEEMTNISKATRAELDKRFFIPFLELCEKFESTDGTTKFVWVCADGSRFESVYIPEENRATLCMSTQVGCAMACTFCLTGDLGLKRNLAPSEIANQPLQVQALVGEGQRISNLVLMGMGEPLHNLDNLLVALEIALDDEAMNFSHRKITVSTVGLVPQMARLAEALPVNLAVSLNATTEEQRLEVMPITRRYSLETLLNACRDFPLPHAKRITFEYVMMAGFNDSLEDAHRLAALMQGIKSKVNLIPYNENPDRDIQRPTDARVKQFQHILMQSGLQCSVRVTRGRDISAACGQLGKAGVGASPTT
jgi:23S rRNA (adenine2503-C2)-methyltransferase